MTEWRDDLRETNKLIREVILPELIQLRIEIASLRKHTWPHVQATKEQHQLDDMESKVDFFSNLDDHETVELLNLKTKLSNNSGSHQREYDIITSLKK
jgi:hypothetical protein